MVTRDNIDEYLHNNSTIKHLEEELIKNHEGSISYYVIDNPSDNIHTLMYKYIYTDSTDLQVTRKKSFKFDRDFTEEEVNNIIKQVVTFVNCEKDKFCSYNPTNSYASSHELTPDAEKELDDYYMSNYGRHVVIQKGEVEYEEEPSNDIFSMSTTLTDEENSLVESELDKMFEPSPVTVGEFSRYISAKLKSFKANHRRGIVSDTDIMVKIDMLFSALDKDTISMKELRRREREAEKETNRRIKESQELADLLENESEPYDPNCDEARCILDNKAINELSGAAKINYFTDRGHVIDSEDIEYEENQRPQLLNKVDADILFNSHKTEGNFNTARYPNDVEDEKDI